MFVSGQERGSVGTVGGVRGDAEARWLIDGRRASHGGRMRCEALKSLGYDTRSRHAHFASNLVHSDGKAEVLGCIFLDRECVV